MLVPEWTGELLTGGYTRDKIRRTLEKVTWSCIGIETPETTSAFSRLFASAVQHFIGALGV